MSRRYAREPGTDQIAAWKATIAEHKRQQRQRRGRPREQALLTAVTGPGMARRAAKGATSGQDPAEGQARS
jgi:hypothetical protein